METAPSRDLHVRSTDSIEEWRRGSTRGAERHRVRAGPRGRVRCCVLATLGPHRLAGVDGPPIVVSWPQPSEGGSDVGDRFDPVPGPLAPPIDVPPQSPIGLPPIDARTPFDPKLLLRGVREAAGDHGVGGAPEGPWSPARSGRAGLPGAPELAPRLRGCGACIRAGRPVPARAHARAGGAGARAPADQLHAQAASLTVEPPHLTRLSSFCNGGSTSGRGPIGGIS